MKKKGNSTVKKKSPDMVLHRTFRGTKAVPSATQGLAHKLRNLTVPIIDIRKDNSLLSLGLEDQGHGVWRINTNLKPTRYHRPIRTKGSKEENPLVDGGYDNPFGRRGSMGSPKAVTDNGLGGDTMVSSEGRKTSKKVATKDSPILVDLTVDDEEISSVCKPSTRVRDRKKRLSSVSSNERVEKEESCWAKDKNSDIRVTIEVQSNPDVKTRSSRNQPARSSPNENQVNQRSKKTTPEVSPSGRRDMNIALPLGSNGVKRSPRVVIKNIAPSLKSVVPRQKSPSKRNESRVFGGRGTQLKKSGDSDSNSKVKKYGLRSVTPPAGNAGKKRKGEICGTSSSVNTTKPAKVQRLLMKKSEGRRKTSSTSTLPPNLSRQEKTAGPSKKNASPAKPKRNSGSKKNTKDRDFKVSPSTTANGKALPKLKLTRKHQNKLQMQWCEICGVELDSLDNKLEHEFRHEEPRQLFVTLHRCYLNHPTVKLPMYVSSEELAAIPDPQEDTSSPISSDDEAHPLLPIDDVLNSDEENAYESYSSSDDECILGTEVPLGEGGTQGSLTPPSGAPNEIMVCDAATSPFTTPERSTPVKSPKSISSKERSKRKSQVKMRLWQGSPITRSGRVIKVTQKTMECMEQQLGCVRVLFSEQEAEGSGVGHQPNMEEDDVVEEKYADDDVEENKNAEDDAVGQEHAEDDTQEQKHAEDDLVEEKHAEDDVVEEKRKENDVEEDKNREDYVMEEKHAEGDVVKEKYAEDDVVEQKRKENDLEEDKNGEDNVMEEKHAEDDVVEEKHAEDDVVEQKCKENDVEEDKNGEDYVMEEKHAEDDVVEEKHEEDDVVKEQKAEEDIVEEEHGEKESSGAGKEIPLVDDYADDVMKGNEDVVESYVGDSRKIDGQSPKRDASPGVELRLSEDSQAHEPSLEENKAKETKGHLFTDVGTTENEAVPVETDKLSRKENEDDAGLISTRDPVDIGLLPGDSLQASEPSRETNDALETELLESSIISQNVKECTPEKNTVLSYEKDEGFSSLGNIFSVNEKDKSLKKGEVIEDELDKTPDLNQNITQEIEPDESSEMPVETLAGKKPNENQKECCETSGKLDCTLASKKSVEDQEDVVTNVIDEISLPVSGDINEQKAVSDSKQGGKVSEPDKLETIPVKDSALSVAEDKLGIGELFEDAVDDNSKDIMLVDEGNDVLVGGALAENVEMQESSETEFVSVPSDIDINKFNMTDDQGLEDISDDEWSDISDKEMQQSPQFVNGNLADVEMDEEGPAASINNMGQEGAMDLEETEKDAGLPDPMCTGEVAGESLEEEMKDLESAEDAIMSENMMDEMVGVLSSKDDMCLAEGIGPATEVDMTEPLEDPEEGCIAEVNDTVQDERVELAEKVHAGEQVTVEGGSDGLLASNVLREQKIVDPLTKNISEDIYKGENNVLGDYTATEEVPDATKLPVNGIELVAVVGSGGDQGDDILCGERVEVAETSDSIFVRGCKGDTVDALKECGATMKNELSAASRKENAKNDTLRK